MANLSDILEKRTQKKFVKKSYRPWDLTGTSMPLVNEPSTEIETPVNVKNLASLPLVKKEVAKPVKPTAIQSDNETGNELGNKQVTKRQQINNIQGTNEKQTDHIRITNSEHTGNELDNELGNENSINFYIEVIKKLAGIQEKIFYFIVEICSSRGVFDTGNILTSDLALAANCSIGSAKTSLIRIEAKKIVMRKPGKSSRGGHLVLGINKEIRIAAIQVQQEKEMSPIITQRALLKLQHTGNKSGNELDNSSYSSSSYNNNITTTSLPDDWEQIDFNDLLAIGFSKTQLQQLFEKGMNTPEVIQESIYQFAYALEHNSKTKAYPDPLNVFMGVLRKGGAWIEKSYISPKEKSLEELLQFKKREAERMLTLEKNILEEEYKIWLEQLSLEEKTTILNTAPKTNFISKGIAEKVNEGFLLNYFKEKIQFKKNL